jgi:Xaa-Pro aminopeptidase
VLTGLAADPKQVADALGCDPLRDLLVPSLMLEAPRWGIPLIFTSGEDRTLLCRDVERANVESHRPSLAAEYFAPYFMVERDRPTDAHADLPSAVGSLSDGRRVVVEAGSPYGIFAELERHGLATKPAPSPSHPVLVRGVDRASVVAEFRAHAPAAERTAAKIAATRPAVSGGLGAPRVLPDSRFDRLDDLLARLGVDALLASSSLNRQELAGLAGTTAGLVLAVRGHDEIYVIGTAGAATDHGEREQRFASLPDAVEALISGDARLAIEERDLPLGMALLLHAHDIETVDATVALSRWREARAHEDLPYAVIAAQASRFAIEGALADLQDRRSRGLATTELDVRDRYLSLVEEFRREHDVPFAVAPYFTNLHGTDRALRPAAPTDAPVTPSTPSVKFDAGLLVCAGGLVMGSSDVARTLALTPELEEARRAFESVVLDVSLPALRPGMTGADVHRHVTAALDAVAPDLDDLGVHPGPHWRAATSFDRNVGHLMSKQESLVTEFTADAEEALADGSVVAVEIQWAFGAAGLAHEEMAVVTSSGGVPLSI